jgi:hypothetical protein
MTRPIHDVSDTIAKYLESSKDAEPIRHATIKATDIPKVVANPAAFVRASGVPVDDETKVSLHFIGAGGGTPDETVIVIIIVTPHEIIVIVIRQ